MAVYPAAGLINYTRSGATIYYIDPKPASVPSNITVMATTATQGMKQLLQKLKP
jgi:NAD-dependent deacetylase